MKQFWIRYLDLFQVLFGVILLTTINEVSAIICKQKFTLVSNATDFADEDFGNTTIAWLNTASSVSIVLSLPLTTIAGYFSATNDRLTFPIRLLAFGENLSKFFFVLFYGLPSLCQMTNLNIQCPSFVVISYSWFIRNISQYAFFDSAQYCQLMISVSRFFAVASNGLYFHSTLRFPWAQFLIPFLIGGGFRKLFAWIFSAARDTSYLQIFVFSTPYFMQCSMDLVTNRRMKTLKRSEKTTKAENLLMTQMLFSSGYALTITIFGWIIQIIVQFFFGIHVQSLLTTLLSFNRYFLFFFVNSAISSLCFRKRREKIRAFLTATNHTTTTGPSTSNWNS